MRVDGSVGLSGTAAESLILSSEWSTKNPIQVIYPGGDVEVTFKFGDFLGGLEKLKALHLKKRRRHLKNEVFRVCIMTPLS